MTVTTTANKVVYAGNGSTTVFPFSFPIPDANSIVVTYTDTTGASTTLTANQYTVTGLGSGTGGSVTYNPSGTPIATGTTLTILRANPIIQATTFLNQSSYNPQAIESAFDYVTEIIQNQQGNLSQCIRVPASDPALNLLPAASLRASMFLAFDANGQPILSQMTPVSGGSITSVSSIAALGALTGTMPAFVMVLGYFSNGDLGGGIFWWNSASTTTDDGGSVIKVSSITTGRFIRLIFNSTIYAAGFGILNDSTATVNGTDNSTQINSLIAFLAANDGLTVVWPQDPTKVVGFTAQLVFNHNRNVKHVFGSPLRNIDTGSNKSNGISFGCDPFINRLAGSPTEISRQLPFPIATVTNGNNSVTLSTHALASNFTVGSWALVCGYDQQGNGYPPNYRYFEWKRVLSANAGTGVIGLDKPLNDSYYSTWYNYTDAGGWVTGGGFVNIIGPAGIVPLDRTTSANFCEYLQVDNLNVLDNPADVVAGTVDSENFYASSTVYFFGCLLAVVNNLKCSQVTTGSSFKVVLNNPVIVYFEPDKIQDTLEINGGIITQINQATGVNFIVADKTTYKFQAAPVSKNYRAVQCRYLGTNTGGASGPIGLNVARYQQSHVYQDNIFSFAAQQSLLPGQSPTESGGAPYIPGFLSATVLATPSGTTFTVAFGDGTFRINAGIGTTLTRPTDNARFNITNITFDGTNFVVAYDSAYQVAISDVLYYYTHREMRLDGNFRIGRFKRIPWLSQKRVSDIYINTADGYLEKSIDVTFRDVPPAPSSNNLYEIDGYLTEIEVNVITAYTGAGDVRLVISAFTPNGATYSTTISTSHVGQRVIRVDTTLNAQSGDTLTVLGYGNFIGLINIRPLAADNPGATGWEGYVRIKAVRR